ncbi:hypothetical protein [Aeromicrobium piscarium]|uniref:Phage tail protein n=1 Tax=Aeromicrobium piscarium TaxID=2590901 RepID=A0A554SP76_9ACTN|nr:hypothetical protein [Aeromicrobium piscarium]TSD68140.1 hypothetical protein FNM00_00650 [Aeromicrobium piscarium]
MSLTWYLADLQSDQVIDVLPLSVGSMERTISAATSTTASLDIKDPTLPPNWSSLVDGRRQYLVPVDTAPDGVETPLLGYLVERVIPGEPEVPFALKSLESALELLICRDHDFTQVDASQILATLCSDVLASREIGGWRFELDVTDCGLLLDQDYYWTEDRTIASAADDLTSAEGGPEYLVRVTWADDDHTRFRKTIEIGPQVGHDMATTVIENGDLSSRTRPRDWSEFGTHVIATGDGSGDSRPMSQPVVDDEAMDAGVPRRDVRHAASSVDDEAVLDVIAAGEAARRRYGTRSWELEIVAAADHAPRVGRDFDAGDTVYMDLGPWWRSNIRRFRQGFGIGRFGAGAFGVGEGSVSDEDFLIDPAEWRNPDGTPAPARLAGWRATVQGRTITHVTPVFWDEEGER